MAVGTRQTCLPTWSLLVDGSGQSYFEWLKNCHRRTPPMLPAAAIAVVVVITQTALVQDSHNPFTTLIPCLQTIGRVAISWQASSNITQ
jgi:hypothetical protein